MNNHYRLAEAAVCSRHLAAVNRRHLGSAPATPADLIFGTTGPRTGKTRHMLRWAAGGRPVVVLDEIANVDPLPALVRAAGGKVLRPSRTPRHIAPLSFGVQR